MLMGSAVHIVSPASKPNAGRGVSMMFKNWSVTSAGRAQLISIVLNSKSPNPCSEPVSWISSEEGEEKVNAGDIVGECAPGWSIS